VIGKAQETSTRLANVIDHQNDAIDAMLSALDADLEYSRSIMRAMEEREKEVDWRVIKQKAVERNQTECPVCLREMDVHHCEVTSCAHLFHRACLESWLAFCGAQDRPPTCPVCRGTFQHRSMCEDAEEPPEREEPPKTPTKKKATLNRERERKRWH
jgi:hypothetical protein